MLAGSGGSASFAQEVAVGARGQRLGEDSGCGACRHGGPRDLPEGGGARGAGVNRSGQVGREGGADRRGATSCGAVGAFGASQPIRGGGIGCDSNRRRGGVLLLRVAPTLVVAWRCERRGGRGDPTIGTFAVTRGGKWRRRVMEGRGRCLRDAASDGGLTLLPLVVGRRLLIDYIARAASYRTVS